MALKQRIAAVLEPIHRRLFRLEDADKAHRLAMAGILDTLARIERAVAEGNLTGLRALERWSEESSRRGEESHRHQNALLNHESRIHHLEHPGNGLAAE